MRKMLGRDTLSVVADGEFVGTSISIFHFHTYDAQACGTRGISYRVVYEIAEYAIYQCGIALDVHLSRHILDHINTFLLELQSSILQYIVHHLGHVHLLVHLGEFYTSLDALLSLIQFGKRGHILQESAHALALRITSLQEVLTCILFHVGVLDDTLQETSDAGSRCLQFVCSILRKLLFDAEFLFFGMMEFPIEHDDGV